MNFRMSTQSGEMDVSERLSLLRKQDIVNVCEGAVSSLKVNTHQHLKAVP